ncbi:MAG: cysteine hydrolase family protein [Henriciella sp.]
MTRPNTKMHSAFAALAIALALTGCAEITASAQSPYDDPVEPALPQSEMQIIAGATAIVITDPQIDFLSPDGVTWGVVGESVTEHNTVENIGRLMKAAKDNDLPLFISPHHYYPTDHGWRFEGPLENLMHSIGMFDREGPYSLDGFDGSGSDFMPEYKPHIHDGSTIITSPHKIYGPEQNDLVLQLRKRGVSKVVLAGMSANLCTQAHLYELLEQGFEVAVVRDATAAAKLPEGDGYHAALVNFRFVANGLWTTDDAIAKIEEVG